MTQRLRPLAALVIAALIGAGCSDEPAENGGTGNENATKAMKFAQCMRDNGVKEFPDPDASGELTIDGVLNGSSLDSSSAAWKQASSACKDLEPAGFTGGGKRSAREQDHALEFAQCMRDNGVKDFPDPVNGQPLVDTRRIPSAAQDGGMTIINAAMQACGESAAEAIGNEP